MVRRGLVFFVLMILSFSSVFASIGVSPATYEVDFKPNSRQQFNFEYYGDGQIGINISAMGDFANNVKIDKTYLEGDDGRIIVTLDFPEEAERPGENDLYIMGEQVVPNTPDFHLKGKIGAWIKINVPFPGKYAQLDFRITDVKNGENVPFVFKVTNLGKETLSSQSYIEVYDGFGEKIDTFLLGSNFLDPNQNVDLSGEMNASNYNPGVYKAIAVVEYDGKIKRVEKVFRIGELYVAVSGYSNNLERNKINKMEIEATSYWNDPIENVYAEVNIVGTNVTFLTPSVTIGGFQKSILAGFFDTTYIKDDKFKAKVVLHYGEKTSERIVDLKFKKEIDYKGYVIIGLLIMFIFIIVVLTVWIIRLETYLHGKEKGKKSKK